MSLLDIQGTTSLAYSAASGLQYSHAATGSIYNLDVTAGSFAQLLLVNRASAAGWVRLIAESIGASNTEFVVSLTGNERLRIKNNGDTVVSGKTSIGSSGQIVLDGTQSGIDYCSAALGQWNLRSDNTGKLKIGRYSGGNTYFYDNGLYVNEITGLTNLVLPSFTGTDSFTVGQYTLRSRAVGAIAFEIYSTIAGKSLLQLDRATGDVTLAAGATLLTGYGTAGLMPTAITSGPYASSNGFAISDYYGNKTGYLVGSNNGVTLAILAYDQSVAMQFESSRVTAPNYYASGPGYSWSPSFALDLSSGHEGGFYLSGTNQVWGSDRTDRVRLSRDGTLEVLGLAYFGASGKTLVTEDANGALISQPTGGAIALKVESGWAVYCDNSLTVHLSSVAAADGAVRVESNGTVQQLTSARWVMTGVGERKSQVGDGISSWQTGYVEQYNPAGIRCGFYDALPVARQQLDSASATLAADLLAALTNLGLVETL